MTKALIGMVWNSDVEEFWPVIGFEFSDSPGYYQFYRLTDYGHFRKSPSLCDIVAEIPHRLAIELKNALRARK